MIQSSKSYRAILCLLSACAVFFAAQFSFQPFSIATTSAAQQNWQALGLANVVVNSLDVHPSDNRIMVAATDAGLYRTTDGGANWTLVRAVQTGIAGDALPYLKVSINPSAPNVILASYGTGLNLRLIRSADNGANWTNVTATGQYGAVFGVTGGAVMSIAYVRNSGNLVFLALAPGYNSGYFISQDGGQSFTQPVNTPFNPQAMGFVFTTPNSPSVAYAFVGDDCWKSADNGATWTLAGLSPRNMYNQTRAAVGTSNPNILYAAGLVPVSAGVVFKSTDAGSNWTPVLGPISRPNPTGSTGPASVVATGLVVDPTNPDVVYATVASQKAFPATEFSEGVFKTTDGGQSWTPLNTGINFSTINSQDLKLDAAGANLRLATTSGVYSYALGGTSCVAPQISTARGLKYACEGNSYSFNVDLVAGTQPVTYQWTKNGVPMPGFTNASFTIPSLTAADSGSYGVTVTNAFGTVSSRDVAELFLNIAPFNGPTGSTSVPASGATSSYDLRIGWPNEVSCTTSTSSNVPWITITFGPTSPGSVNPPAARLITYTVAPNTGAARQGIITTSRGSLTSTFTINQAAGTTGGAQNVVWTELANAQLFGNVLRKVGGATDGTWDGRAVSQQSITSGDATLEFTISGANVYRAIGLSNDLPSGNPDQLDFAVYLTNINLAEFRENGVYRGDATIKNGDVIRIELKAGKVSFYVNGLLSAMAVNAPKYPLKVVALFSQPGGEITNAKLSGLSGGSCTYSLSRTSETILANGVFNSATILSTQSGCAWTATSNASWLTITSATSGTGSAEIRYQATSNVGPARTGVITVAGQTLTISQAGNQVCTYTILPTNVNASAAESTGSISVVTQAGCGWQFVNNTAQDISWFSWIGGDTRIGNGSVNYRIIANTGVQRVAILTIPGSGKTFTLTQAGAATGGNGVRWTNLVNTTLVGDILRKTGGASDGRYDGWARSDQSFASGEFYLEFTAAGPFAARSAGLSDVAPSGDLNAVDYEVRFTGSNIVEFRERGAYRGDAVFKNGEIFRVAVEAGRVNFYVNGVVLAQSASAPPYPLRTVALFSNVGGELAAAKLFSGRPPVTSAARQTLPVSELPCRGCIESAPAIAPSRLRFKQRH